MGIFFSDNLIQDKPYLQYQINTYQNTILLETDKGTIPLKVFSADQRTQIRIDKTTAKQYFKQEIPLNIPGNFQKATNARIIIQNKTIFLLKKLIIAKPFVAFNQADAQQQNYQQGQKIALEIPYKNIEIPNLTIKIKDYFLPDIFVMQNDAKKRWAKNQDRAQEVHNIQS